MKAIIGLGVAMLLLGLAALTYPIITYTDRDRVVNVGPVEISTNEEKRIRVPTLAGGAMIATGLVLLTVGRRKKPGSHAANP